MTDQKKPEELSEAALEGAAGGGLLSSPMGVARRPGAVRSAILQFDEADAVKAAPGVVFEPNDEP